MERALQASSFYRFSQTQYEEGPPEEHRNAENMEKEKVSQKYNINYSPSYSYKSQPMKQFNLNSIATDLSQGQQQLLTLAYALLRQESRLILLDEPTSQIDYTSQQIVLNAIFNQAEQHHATVLMIAHRLETAISFSDKILVMDKG